jgi:hypothetical protein
VWRGDAAYGPEEDPFDPRRRLARESIRALRNRHKRKGRTGGVW